MLTTEEALVALGTTTAGRVIVLQGLKTGEKVAADGAFKLREGVLVQSGQSPAATPEAPAAAGPESDVKQEQASSR